MRTLKMISLRDSRRGNLEASKLRGLEYSRLPDLQIIGALGLVLGVYEGGSGQLLGRFGIMLGVRCIYGGRDGTEKENCAQH